MRVSPKVAVKILQKKEKITQQQIGERSGLGKDANISQYISRDMRLSVFQKIIRVMGYEIAIKPIEEDIPDGYIGIDTGLPNFPPGLLEINQKEYDNSK